MKKLFGILAIAVVTFLAVSCGPSAAELREKAVADSIRTADSIAMVQAEQQRIADSITKAIEVAKANSITKTTK